MAHEHDDLPDEDLRRLLSDAVADIDPRDGLGAIRRRTTRPPRRRARGWPLLVLGAGTATAAVVGTVALVGSLGSPADQAPAGPPEEPADAVAAYFVGQTPVGPRLFREFQAISPADEEAPLALAALRLLESDAGPLDPDYTTGWADGSFTAVSVGTGRIDVLLADRVDPLPAGPAAQQAVFTVQAALGRSLPVAFSTPEGTLDVGGRASVGRDTALLAPVNVTDPVEGHTVDDLLTVRGVVSPAGTAPAAVDWELLDVDDEPVVSGSAPVADRAWEQTTSIADVGAGTYVLRVRVPTPGGAPATDTRTVTVR